MPERSFAESREKIGKSRAFPWALESPVAEIMIYSYVAFMIFSGIFTILSYAMAKVRNNLMKVCLVVNSLYIVAGILMICMSTALRELL